MTILEALMSECMPYTISANVYTKALVDVGLDGDDEYTASMSGKIFESAAKSLSNFLVLTSESEGGFSQGFDADKLKERIKSLSKQAGIDPSTYTLNPTINTQTIW